MAIFFAHVFSVLRDYHFRGRKMIGGFNVKEIVLIVHSANTHQF